MQNKNSLPLGLLAGAIAPVIAWIIFDYILHNDALIMNKPGVPYLIAIGINLVLIRFAVKRGLDQTSRGIMLITFVAMVLLFVLKINIR
jgi:hypothetical protein